MKPLSKSESSAKYDRESNPKGNKHKGVAKWIKRQLSKARRRALKIKEADK